MSHQQLRELCKLLAGVVAGKLLVVSWLYSRGLLPIAVRGTIFAQVSVLPAFIFTICIFVILVYYGWHIKSPVHSPTEHKLLLVAGTIFFLVALLHLLRLAFGWTLVIGTIEIPVWLSWVGVAFAAYLSYASFHFALRTHRH